MCKSMYLVQVWTSDRKFQKQFGHIEMDEIFNFTLNYSHFTFAAKNY